MYGSGKKIYNSDVQTAVFNRHLNGYLSDKHERDKATRKLARQENPSAYKIKNDKYRAIQQRVAAANATAKKNVAAAERELAEKLYTYIVGKLDFSGKLSGGIFYRPNISYQQIEEVIHSCMPALIKLRKLAMREQEFANVHSDYKFNKLDNLFNDLIKLDIRFAAFAPYKSVTKDLAAERISTSNPDSIREVLDSLHIMQADPNNDYIARSEGKEFESPQEIVDMVDHIGEVEFNAYHDMIIATEMLQQDLYSFIVKEVNLNEQDQPDLPIEDIEHTLDYCSSAIKLLHTLSNTPKLQELAAWDESDPHTNLYIRLMNEHMRFALFAPKKALDRPDMEYQRLTKKDRNHMLRRLIDTGLWDDDQYYEYYRSIFEYTHSVDDGATV